MQVAFIQNNPVFGDTQGNLESIQRWIPEITADLLVLPELFTTGYQFLNKNEAMDLAEPIPDGPTCDALRTLAGQIKGTLVAGLAEREGDAVYNSSVIVGPSGYIGKYRKIHLFDTEKEVFQPGNLPLQVFDIGPAKLGVMICFDWRFPETARTLALKGAEIIAHPANLVLEHCPQAMITRCLENRVFIVTADRVGREERQPGNPLLFMGQSQVVDPDGNILVRASLDQEQMQVVEIDIKKARNKSINSQNDLFKDRREELYKMT